MPCDAVKADFDSVLTGVKQETRVFTGRITFCVVMSHRGALCVHFDPQLKSCQRLCLVLLMQVVRAGMIEFADYAEPSVAPFSVAKDDGSGKARMVLDTRRVVERFIPPDTTELTTPGAWQGLRTVVGSYLNIAQVDTECAFYLIATTPGLSKLMVLPRFGGRTSPRTVRCPRLVVLTMGWN